MEKHLAEIFDNHDMFDGLYDKDMWDRIMHDPERSPFNNHGIRNKEVAEELNR